MAVLGVWVAKFIAAHLTVLGPDTAWIVANVAPSRQTAAFTLWGWLQFSLACLLPAAATAAAAVRLRFGARLPAAAATFLFAAAAELGLRFYTRQNLGAADVLSLVAVAGFAVWVWAFVALLAVAAGRTGRYDRRSCR